MELIWEIISIAQFLLSELRDAIVRFIIKSVIGFLDKTFPEHEYRRVRYDPNGQPKTGSRALRFLREERNILLNFIKFFPTGWNDPNSSYYWKYYVSYFWHQTIKRETFGHRLNPKRNMMVLVEITAGIFLMWAVGWHFHSLVSMVWFDAPWWYNALTIIILLIAEVVTVEFVRFLAWIEFFKSEIEFFYTSPWYMDGGKLNGRTLVVNLIWRAMNAVVFLTIASYCPKAIDPRVYDIVTRAVWWLAPMILASTLLYFALPICHFLDGADEMNKVAVTRIVMSLVLITVIMIVGSVIRFAQMGLPEGFSITLPHFTLFDRCTENCVAGTWKDGLIWGAKILGAGVFTVLVLLGVAWLINKLWESLLALRVTLEDDTERTFTYKNLWWVPSVTVMLFWCYFIPSYYQEVYLPDRLAAQQAAAIVQTVEPEATPAPEATLTPAFTATNALSTETLTVIPVTPTLTATPAPFTATASPLPTFTSTSTQTMVPSPTATETATVDPNTPQMAVTQDMTLPEPASADALVANCLGAHQGADYLLNADPDKAYCIQGLTTYSAAGARYKINGKDYIFIFVVADNAARYYLSGDIPETAVCTVNGVTFNGGTYNYVNLTDGNTNSRVSCTFDGLTITATGWSFK